MDGNGSITNVSRGTNHYQSWELYTETYVKVMEQIMWKLQTETMLL